MCLAACLLIHQGLLLFTAQPKSQPKKHSESLGFKPHFIYVQGIPYRRCIANLTQREGFPIHALYALRLPSVINKHVKNCI